MKVLWGTRRGNEEWQEELITEIESNIPAAQEWAKIAGFDRLRVAEIDIGIPPDFRQTLRTEG